MASPGRPTKYNEDILAKAKEYLTAWEENGDVIPSVESLSIYLDIARSTIYDWASQEDKKAFSDTLDKISVIQKQVLIKKGLTGEFNAAITKLVLTNHGMTDKQDVNIGGQPNNPVSAQIEWVVQPVKPINEA